MYRFISFHGHTFGFHPQILKIRTTLYGIINSTTWFTLGLEPRNKGHGS